MEQRITAHKAVIFIAGLFLLALNGCKEDTILDASIVPIGDTIFTTGFDTATILSRTFFDDSLNTSSNFNGAAINNQALGTITTDPYTGKTYGSVYFQVIPERVEFNFPKPPDSAFLILPYARFTWGDTINPGSQKFTVYEVTESMSKDTSYFNFTYKDVDRSNPDGIGTVTISNYKTIADSVSVNGVKQAPHLRVPLEAAFIQKMKDAAAAGTNFKSYPEFLSWFKGICIEPDTNNGAALYYFRLDGDDAYSRANILFYYTDDSNKVQTSTFYYTSQYNSHFNRVRRNYAGSKVLNYLNSPLVSDSVFIIQNEPGAVADLKFPFIKNLPKYPINKAELIITQVIMGDDGQQDKYYSPARLFPIGIASDGAAYTVLDRYPLSSVEPLDFMDGRRRSFSIPGGTVHQYVLNLPREVQRAIVEQRDTLHLRVNGASGYPGAYRLISGGGNSIYKVKLNIVYSKI